jgi:hypothetical protein
MCAGSGGLAVERARCGGRPLHRQLRVGADPVYAG